MYLNSVGIGGIVVSILNTHKAMTHAQLINLTNNVSGEKL
tara:strand:+ start:144 stop:263 length:120 start_codon:yes stop_codon:yes gene_type:complete